MADVNKSVNIAINVVSDVGNKINSIGSSFGVLTGKVNIATSAIRSFKKEIDKIRVPAGIDKIGNGLKSISNINSKNIGGFADELKKIDKAKFPDFAKINSDLARHNTALREVINSYRDLTKAAGKVNLKNISKNASGSSKQIKNLSNQAKKSGTSFSQWGFALGSASTGLSKFGTQIYGVTRGFSAVSKELTASMLAFTTVFSAMFALKGVITDIVKFDDAIRAAGAVAGASSMELEMFSDAAREMGESTRYTATSAAEALKALAMTGLSVTESMATLPTVMSLAAASNMDLGKSADIVTNIMVGYGKSVKDLPHIADLMTAAFTSSNTSLEQVGIALQYVGPVAKAAGISLEETTGILASLANAGYRGSKAGTTLRTAISRLLAPTDSMRAVLDKYDISMSQLVNEDGSMKSFTDMLDIMRTKSVTAGDAITLFGKRAGPGILSLIGQSAKQIENMNIAIANSKGIAIKVAYEMESGLGGSLRKLKSMWEELSIAIGKAIEDDVNEFVKSLTKTLKDNKDELVAVTKSIFTFIGALAKITGWLIEFVASNATVISSLGLLTIAIRLLTVESQKLLGINLIGMFTDLSKNVGWKKLIANMRLLNISLINYSSAAKGASVATGGLSITDKISAGFSNFGTNIKTLGTTFIKLIKNTGLAIATFIRLNPWVLLLTASLGALIAITKYLNKDYVEMAESNRKAADAAKELNKELEYQLAELGLISREYDSGSTERYGRAEQRLIDVINSANISFREKVRLMELAKTGSINAKKALDSLNKTLNSEKDTNETKILKETSEEIKNLEKAVNESKLKLEEYHNVFEDGEGKLVKYKDGFYMAAKGSNKFVYYMDKAVQKIYGMINSEEDLRKELGKNELALFKANSSYDRLSYKMAISGESAEDFAKKLRLTGKSESEINKATTAYKKLLDAIKDPEVRKAVEAVLSADTTEIEEAAKETVRAYKAKDAEILESQKQLNADLAILESQGVISLKEIETLKIQSYKDSYEKRIQLARQKESEISEFAIEERSKMADTIRDLESEALLYTKQNLAKYITAEKDATDKILEIKKKQAEDEIELENKKTSLIIASANKIANLKTSLEDKVRSISQKGMTDEQKSNSNRIAANKKMVESYKLLKEYEKTGDSSTLSRLQSLVGSAGDLYGNLNNSKEAYQGIQLATKQLEKIEKTRLEFEIKKTEEAARKKKEKTDNELKDQQELKDASLAAIKSITELLNGLDEGKDVKIKIEVEKKELDDAKPIYDSISDKTAIISESTKDEEKWTKIKETYDALKDKTVTINVDTEGNGATLVKNNADGGYVMPSFFAKGGDVFRKLLSPFITSGSGNKDDVPAMLMKGEYVQTQSAVKKYGTSFMDSIRNGSFPLELALKGIRGFASGGSVFSGIGSNAPTPSVSSNSNNNSVSVDLNILSDGPPIKTSMDGNQVNELFRQMNIMKSRLS